MDTVIKLYDILRKKSTKTRFYFCADLKYSVISEIELKMTLRPYGNAIQRNAAVFMSFIMGMSLFPYQNKKILHFYLIFRK